MKDVLRGLFLLLVTIYHAEAVFKADPFVQGAPIAVVARCKDGICFVAAHTSDENDPLLYYDGNESKKNDHHFENLPRGYGGPFRIHEIGYGSVLLTVGWRADCEELAECCRDISNAEIQEFGHGQMYGIYLAYALSLYLAQCVVSDSQRALSAIGLLATCYNGRSTLSLIDPTGDTSINFLAVGGGKHEGKRISDAINERLADCKFTEMAKSECFLRMLDVMKGNNEEIGIKEHTRLELAFLDSISGKVSREFLSSLNSESLIDS